MIQKPKKKQAPVIGGSEHMVAVFSSVSTQGAGDDNENVDVKQEPSSKHR